MDAGIFSPTYYGMMENIIFEKLGGGWTVIPIEFRLTGLKFAAPGFNPRKETIKIPYSSNGDSGVYTTKQPVLLVHFFIEGYWVFRTEKDGKKSELYAISTGFKERTYAHAPYDVTFANELKKLRDEHKGDPSFVIGRPYDRRWSFTEKDSLEGTGLDDLNAIKDKLRVGTKDTMLKDLKPENIIPCTKQK
jgi:hypothetical protein